MYTKRIYVIPETNWEGGQTAGGLNSFSGPQKLTDFKII